MLTAGEFTVARKLDNEQPAAGEFTVARKLDNEQPAAGASLSTSSFSAAGRSRPCAPGQTASCRRG